MDLPYPPPDRPDLLCLQLSDFLEGLSGWLMLVLVLVLIQPSPQRSPRTDIISLPDPSCPWVRMCVCVFGCASVLLGAFGGGLPRFVCVVGTYEYEYIRRYRDNHPFPPPL